MDAFCSPTKQHTVVASSTSCVTGSTNVVSRPLQTELGQSDFLIKNDVLSAEIIWTLKTIADHSSYKANENAGKTFKAMFPDSKIASKLSCGEKKTAYLCVWIGSILQKVANGSGEGIFRYII